MLTVYRYPLNNIDGINNIEIPENAKILSVGVANDIISNNNVVMGHVEVISLWAEVDTANTLSTRKILVFGTGANMDKISPYRHNFLGTVQKSNAYAFHVFEVFD